MLSEQLLDEIIFESKKGKFISIDLIERIVYDIIGNVDEESKNRFSRIIINNTHNNKNYLCLYYPYDGTILVYYKKIISKFINDNTHSILYFNLEIVRYLLHEIEHLMEPSRIKNEKSIESTLLYLSKGIFMDKLAMDKLEILKKLQFNNLYEVLVLILSKKYYEKIYDSIPAERLADIHSSKKLLESVKKYYNFDKSYPKEYYEIKLNNFNMYLIGYSFSSKSDISENTPFIDYINFIKCQQYFKKFDFYSNDEIKFLNLCKEKFNVEQRMRLGLPIIYNEPDKLYKRIMSG